MRRSFEAYLWDVQDAASAILKFSRDKSREDYLVDEMLQAAIERKFEVVGEALTCARREFPERCGDLPDVSAVISFRNQLAHNYNNIDNSRVWEIVQTFLPTLMEKVGVLLTARLPKTGGSL